MSAIEGYEVPLHRSLTEPILLAGAPRGVATFVGTLAAAVGIGLKLWIAGLVIWIAGHTVAVYAARKDPKVMEALARHVKHRSYLAC